VYASDALKDSGRKRKKKRKREREREREEKEGIKYSKKISGRSTPPTSQLESVMRCRSRNQTGPGDSLSRKAKSKGLTRNRTRNRSQL